MGKKSSLRFLLFSLLVSLLPLGGCELLKDLDKRMRIVFQGGVDPCPEGETPLHEAVRRGDPDEVRRLIRSGIDIDAKSEGQETALHLACHLGNEEMVRHLLAAEANALARSIYGGTPLDLAAAGGHEGVVDLLLSHRAPGPLLEDAYWSLSMAALQGHLGIVKKLHQAGVKFDSGKPPPEESFLSLILFFGGGRDTVAYLLDHHLVRLSDLPTEHSPLVQAAWAADLPTLRLLVERGFDPGKEDSDGRSLAHILAERLAHLREQVEKMRLQKKTGSCSERSGAARRRMEKELIPDTSLIFRRLLEIQEKALERGHAEIFEYLASKGLDFSKQTASGRTAAMIAEDAKDPGLAALLRLVERAQRSGSSPSH